LERKLKVFVVDKHKKPLMPCSLYRAHLLLERGRAVVHKRYPFTIRIKDRAGGEMQDVRVKIDPGSKVTGIAVVREGGGNEGATVLWLAELTHRGRQISEALTARRGFRRRRRGANLRYRAPRFDNRGADRTGWLPPSLRHRIDTTLSWVNRLRRLVPVTAGAVERVRFDMQVLENPEISGVGYQQGTLAGYEVREYVLERDGRHCSYCGVKGVPLNLDHVNPRARGGSSRPSIHVGRVAVRATGSFNVGAVQGINWKHCRIIHRADGYGYAVSASPVRDFVPTAFLPAPYKGGVSSGRL
jgi:hypothetical protein